MDSVAASGRSCRRWRTARTRRREVFAAAQAEEQAPFAGDWTIWWAIASLAAAPRALLHTADGAPLPPPPPARGGEAFLRSRIALTVDGEDVLAGRADQSACARSTAGSAA